MDGRITELLSNHELIRRVLLQDYVRESIPTRSFEDFEQGLDHRETVDQTIAAALRDRLEEQEDPLPDLRGLLDDLMERIKSLVPSRSDLHAKFSIETPATTTEELYRQTRHAARLLMQLEAPVRSLTTKEWLQLSSPPLATSLLYLLYKADLCTQDKEDFYWETMFEPQIRQAGPEILRQAFVAQYDRDPPLTRRWLASLERQETPKRTFQKGFVHNLLLTQQAVELPEIFDKDRLRQLRHRIRLGTAASALMQHVGGSVDAEALRVALTTPAANEETYRLGVVEVLRRGSTRDDQFLLGQVQRVLQSEDPVLKLLQKRFGAALEDKILNGKDSLEQRGLHSKELQATCQQAQRWVDLTWELYGDLFLRDMMAES